MKKLIVLLIMMCGFAPVLWAADGCQQHLSPTEFRAKQQAYITEKAGLTKEEAAKFFPLYFELSFSSRGSRFTSTSTCFPTSSSGV